MVLPVLPERKAFAELLLQGLVGDAPVDVYDLGAGVRLVIGVDPSLNPVEVQLVAESVPELYRGQRVARTQRS